ncbi:Mch5p [Sugiyamaella lignohabitans]|uniref:Mch5p n=1 Tax=Sugiyamaella lignohabitans TaxID=796027 RepID=A0A161HMU0_9ASCO|nr:Mch5p [Sugiyamaella lignohabitans]ANB15247.1 Mch5p [Sugiyamaella lignohabitans]
MCVTACVMLKPRLEPRKSGPLIDYASFKDFPFIFATLAFFFGYMGMYIPIYYIQNYALKINVDQNLAMYFVTILNAGSTLGRILPSYVADKVGPLNALFPCMVIATLLIYCWIAIKNRSGLIAFAVLDGFFTGTFVSLPPACISYLTPDMSLIGTRIGMSFFVAAFGALAGAPVAGALLTRDHGNYLYAQLFSGTCMALCSSCVLASILANRIRPPARPVSPQDTEADPKLNEIGNEEENDYFNKVSASEIPVADGQKSE